MLSKVAANGIRTHARTNQTWAQNPGELVPSTFLPGGALMLLSLQIYYDTKSIICHQVQLIYFFYHLKSVATTMG